MKQTYPIRQRKLPKICRVTLISALATVCMLLFSGQEVRADIQTNVGVSRIAPLPDKIAPINAPFPMSPLKRPVFPDRSFNLTDYGAKGDGTTKNTESFRNAIAACNAAGGGRVIVLRASGSPGRSTSRATSICTSRKARKSISVTIRRTTCRSCLPAGRGSR